MKLRKHATRGITMTSPYLHITDTLRELVNEPGLVLTLVRLLRVFNDQQFIFVVRQSERSCLACEM